jgi:branched-chain amino acid transport system substrate-binding protein
MPSDEREETVRQKIVIVGLALAAVLFGPGQGRSEEPISIGTILPMSGQYGDYVKRYMAAATEIATQEANDKGGVVGRKVKLTEEDSRLDGATAVSALNKLADVDKVLAVFTAFTPTTLPQLPVAEQKHVLVMAASTEHPDLTKSRWAVRMTPTADKAGVVIADLATKMAMKTAAVLSEDNEAVRITVRAFTAEYEKSGGKVVADETFKSQDTDMRGQLTKIRAARPDALYIMVTAGRPIALALKQISEVGLRPKQIYANHLIEDREVQSIGGAVAEGVIYTSLDMDPVFAARFKARFGYDPDSNAGKHYDATWLFFDAIKRVGSADDTAKIRDAIYNYGQYKGVVGNFEFSGSGEPKIFPILKVVKGGEYVKYPG